MPDNITLDLSFWGVRLSAPHQLIIAPAWDFERVHMVLVGIVELCGVDIAESFLGVVVPSTLRERENTRVVDAAPEALQPEIRMHTSGSRWADIRVALETRLPHAREALSKIVAALASPRLLGTCLGELQVSQGKDYAATPILHQGKLLRGIFARPQDVYACLLGVALENLLPLDDGGIALRKSLPTPAGSLAVVRHWLAYQGPQTSAPSTANPTPPTAA